MDGKNMGMYKGEPKHFFLGGGTLYIHIYIAVTAVWRGGELLYWYFLTLLIAQRNGQRTTYYLKATDRLGMDGKNLGMDKGEPKDFFFGGGAPWARFSLLRLSWPHRVGVAVILLFHVGKSYNFIGRKNCWKQCPGSYSESALIWLSDPGSGPGDPYWECNLDLDSGTMKLTKINK
jgi:hypothetical protein